MLPKFAARQWLIVIAWGKPATTLQPMHELEAIVHYTPPCDSMEYQARVRFTDDAAMRATTYYLIEVRPSREAHGTRIPLHAFDALYSRMLQKVREDQTQAALAQVTH